MKAIKKFYFWIKYQMFKHLSIRYYPVLLKLFFRIEMCQNLVLENPKTLNEKIQWLKLYDSTPLKTTLADKYLVRQWIEEQIGEEYLVPLLGVWDSFNEIDFDALPNKFVLKATHGSGSNLIVEDKTKLDINVARNEFRKWMHTNYAFYSGELHYKDIVPKIIAEKFIENTNGLIDYRFYCFNGKPKLIWVDIYSGTPNHLRNIFDEDWNLLPVTCKWPSGGELLSQKPECLDKMFDIAKLLSNSFSFVRIDFFEVNKKIYMGEMTFTPMSGGAAFDPPEYDLQFGNMLTLPCK